MWTTNTRLARPILNLHCSTSPLSCPGPRKVESAPAITGKTCSFQQKDSNVEEERIAIIVVVGLSKVGSYALPNINQLAPLKRNSSRDTVGKPVPLDLYLVSGACQNLTPLVIKVWLRTS